jgi:sulfate adenylyltransferase large subunit
MVAQRIAGAETPPAAAGLLRFTTAGSVDDGKSTLIGRLLHDSRGIATDQLAALQVASRRRGREGVDLSLLTDGLRAEREQGITIDVAYRYFATARRRFVIADTPGHVQYTRNMVTGCSTADLAVVLIDARRGPTDQTRRHLAVAGLLRVPHVVACVNKMDLVGWREDAFRAIADEVAGIAVKLGIDPPVLVPTSALRGDNIVERSDAMPWYDGPSLLEHLETVEVDRGRDDDPLRFPVQWVIRSSSAEDPDYRAYAGRLESGSLRVGDAVVVLPAGITTRVRSIHAAGTSLDRAGAARSIAVRLADDIDLGRGGMLVGPEDVPEARTELDAFVCWLGRSPLAVGRRYRLRHTTRDVRAVATAIGRRLDVADLERDGEGAATLDANDIGEVRLRLSEPIFADPYRVSRPTGCAILVDETTNDTVGAVLIR